MQRNAACTHLDESQPLLGRQELVAQALVAPVGFEVFCGKGHGVYCPGGGGLVGCLLGVP